MSKEESKRKRGGKTSMDPYKDIPEMVVNKDAYLEYQKYRQHSLLNDDRLYQTSDPNLTVDLAKMPHLLKKDIAHLPNLEQKDIIAQMMAVKAMLGKLSQAKQRAYGVIRGNFIEDNGYLLPRRSELIELFGRMFTVEEVHKKINQEWGLEIPRTAVTAFKTKYLDKIKELQEKYKRDYSHVRLGYKRSRLDELSYLYRRRREIYETQPSAENHRLLLQTLEQIRKECEGDELKVSFEGEININQTINLHLQQDILQKISIKDIVLSRLAAKYNINLQLLLSRLHKSYYAKFVGTVAPDQGLLEDQMIYPSQHIYDFNKIEAKNNLIKLQEQQLVTENEKGLDEETKSKVSIMKQALLDKIRQKQEELNNSKIDLDGGL